MPHQGMTEMWRASPVKVGVHQAIPKLLLKGDYRGVGRCFCLRGSNERGGAITKTCRGAVALLAPLLPTSIIEGWRMFVVCITISETFQISL